jgi:hypothetical protein
MNRSNSGDCNEYHLEIDAMRLEEPFLYNFCVVQPEISVSDQDKQTTVSALRSR